MNVKKFLRHCEHLMVRSNLSHKKLDRLQSADRILVQYFIGLKTYQGGRINKPKVIVYNAASVDGRNTGFEVDMGQYYGLASTWKEDLTLVGSGTILSAPMEDYTETEDDFKPAEIKKDDSRGVMAVVDSGGRVRIWSALRKSGYWKDFIALVSAATPAEYLNYLDKRHISRIKAGTDKVDLRAALVELGQRGFATVRVDAGGVLNSLLLEQELVDEVSVLIHPALAGETGKPFYKSDASVELKLVESKVIENGLVWLRYGVVK